MSKLIAIETATEACSAALWLDGEIIERYELCPRQHSQKILGLVEQLLAEAALTLADLDAVAFGRGPGSFTGVRIAAGITQGLAFGADLPVVPVSTLQAMAHAGMKQFPDESVAVAMDARMGEVYFGCFSMASERMVSCSDEQVIAPSKVVLPDTKSWHGVGDGWLLQDGLLKNQFSSQLSRISADLLPHAADVVQLAAMIYAEQGGLPAAQALPVYLRDQVVSLPAAAKR